MSGFIRKIMDAWRQRISDQPPTSFLPTISSVRAGQSIEQAKQGLISPSGPTSPKASPGNFYSFPFFISLRIRETKIDGYPKVPIRDSLTGEIKWGSHIDWSFPGPDKPQVEWVDDEERGLNKRTIRYPEDALGSEGRLGEMLVRFEKVLTIGKNQVVYALYCPTKNIRLAYGFDRAALEPGYAPPRPEL